MNAPKATKSSINVNFMIEGLQKQQQQEQLIDIRIDSAAPKCF